jgi:hypothetical protein
VKAGLTGSQTISCLVSGWDAVRTEKDYTLQRLTAQYALHFQVWSETEGNSSGLESSQRSMKGFSEISLARVEVMLVLYL